MSDTSISLYIHWPFCLSKCPYCDFNSHLVEQIEGEQWQQAMLSELDFMAQFFSEKTSQNTSSVTIDTIFFGGGTPSLMPPQLVESIIDKAFGLFSASQDIEITAEANPSSVETEKIADFALAGVNRLSLGVQSLAQAGLTFLGRQHSPDDALHALDIAQSHLRRVSCDMIYGLPEQTENEWQNQLERLLARKLDHLSAYQLTIEAGTVFHSRTRKGDVLVADDDNVASLYQLTEQICNDWGLSAYEISNYAKQGEASRHNLCYWRSGNWLAIGPGAHGQFWAQNDRFHLVNRRSPAGWLSDSLLQGHGCEQIGSFSPREIFDNYWMMGLRMTEALALSPDFIHPEFSLDDKWLEIFCEEGWLNKHENAISTNLDGRLRLDYMLAKLLG